MKTIPQSIDLSRYNTVLMLPTYVLTNTKTKKKIALTNARLAFDLYRKIMREKEEEFIAYSTFRQKLKARPIQFFDWVFDRVMQYTNQEVDEDKNNQLLKYLTTDDELAKVPRPFVMNLNPDNLPPARPPKLETGDEQTGQVRLF